MAMFGSGTRRFGRGVCILFRGLGCRGLGPTLVGLGIDDDRVWVGAEFWSWEPDLPY